MDTLQVDFVDGYPRNPPVNSHGNGKLGLLKMYSLLLRGISIANMLVYRSVRYIDIPFHDLSLPFSRGHSKRAVNQAEGPMVGACFRMQNGDARAAGYFQMPFLKGRRWKNSINECVWTCMTASNLHTLGFRIMIVSWGIIQTASHIDAVKSGMTLETYGCFQK